MPSLFSINTHSNFECEVLLREIMKSKNVILIDDSRGQNNTLKNLSLKINQSIPNSRILNLVRKESERLLKPYEDLMNIEYDSVIKSFVSNNQKNK